MPTHRGAGIRHLYSNTILNVVVEIASFFVFAYASSTSTTKLITCIERTKKFRKIGLIAATKNEVFSSL